MNDLLNKISQQAKNIKLSVSEKNLMKERLVSHIQKTDRIVSSSRFNFAYWSHATKKLFTFDYARVIPVALIAILFFGGVSYAAGVALPGDTLYPIKVGFNEKVQAVFNVSNESKVRFETKLAEKRLEEVEKLSLRGPLEVSVETRIKQRFESHAIKVNERIEKIALKDVSKALNLASDFEGSLNAHEAILARIDSRSNQGTEMALMATMALKVAPPEADTITDTSIGSSVRNIKEQSTEFRLKLEAELAVGMSAENKVSAEGKMKAVQNKLREVKSFFEKKTVRMRIESRADIEFKLLKAQELFTEGGTKFKAGLYTESFIVFQTVLRELQEIQISLSNSLKKEEVPQVEINTSHDVEVETLPVIEGSYELFQDPEIKVEVKSLINEKVKIDNGNMLFR